MNKQLAKRIGLYSIILLFLLIDYLSFSSGLSILDKLRKLQALTFLFPLFYVGILALAITTIKGKMSELGWHKGLILLGLIVLSTIYFISLKKDTSRIHFLEYELITILFFKALEFDIKAKLIYPVTLLSIFVLGVFEEIIQAAFPERTFDLVDLKIDFFSSLLMIAIFYIFKEKSLLSNTFGKKSSL